MQRLLSFFLFFIPIVSLAQLNADFSFNNAQGCSPLIVDFTDLSTGNPTSWTWLFGNGNSSNQQNPGAVYINPGTYDVRLIVSDGVSFDTSLVVDAITVYEDPQISFTTDAVSGCAPLEVAFQNTTVTQTGLADIFWNFGDGNTATIENPVNTYSLGQWDVSVLVTDSAGCESQLVLPDYISATSGPTANFTSNGGQSCQFPSTVTFTNTSVNDAGATYLWDFGDGSPSSNLENPSHNYTNFGSYDVTLIVDVNGCSDTITIPDAVVIQPQNASFSADTTEICEGITVNFTDESTLTSNSWLWNFGDGSTSTLQNPSHTYATAGTYTVSMIAEIPGCTDTAILVNYITVNPTPTVSFTSDIQFACSPPFTVNFTSMADPGVTYEWNFTDGGNPAIPNPTHTFFNPGIFDVSLTVTNGAGCSATQFEPDFIGISDPTAIINSDSTSGCVPLTIGFSDASVTNGNVVFWEWDFGDGSPVSNLENPMHTYTDTGTYQVSLIIQDDIGCTDTLINGMEITVGEELTLDFEADLLNACKSDEITFTNFSDTTLNPFWIWNFGDGGIDNGFSPTYSYGDTGTFDVSLSAVVNGCTSDTLFEEYITIFPPVALFDEEYNCTDPLQVTFNDNSIEADSWIYVIENGDSIVGDTVGYTFPDFGSYEVTLYVTNTIAGCVDSITQTINVFEPLAGFTQDTTLGCPILPISFTDTSSNAVSWFWDFGDGGTATSQNPVHNYTQTGIFDVSLTITDSHGCIDSVTQTNLINTLNIQGDFTSDTTSGCRPLTVNFSDLSGSVGGTIVSWEWDFGDGSPLNNTPNPQHVYHEVGTYDVSLIVENTTGCVDTITYLNYINVLGPVPNFVVPQPLCVNGVFTINDNSTGSNLSYAWDFGDGSPINNNSDPSHIYTAEGDYFVTVTLSDDNLCDTTYTYPDTVQVETINVDFSVSDSIDNCPPFAVTFTQEVSPNPTTWQWDFGDGGTSTLANPSYIYNSVDSFTVTLIAGNNAGCFDTATYSDFIIVNGPFGDAAASPTEGCEDLTVSFELTNTNTTSQIWDFGDGFVQDTTAFINHTYTDVGVYNSLVVLTDTGGCTIFYPVDTIIVSSLTADFNALDNYVCTPDTISFEDLTQSADPILSWLWDFGDGNTSTLQNPTHNYTTDGIFDVSLIVENEYCFDTIQYNQIIISDSSTLSNFDFTPSSNCPPSIVTFTDLSTADSSIVSWNWDFNNGNTDVVQNPITTFNQSGTFDVALSITTSAGCVDTFFSSIVIDSLPTVNLTSLDTVLCIGTEWQIDSIGDDTYLWQPATYLSCDDCPNPLISGIDVTDSVVYTIYSENEFGCRDTTNLDLAVLNNPNLEVSQDEVVLAGTEVTMQAFSFQDVVYSWQPDSLLDCSNCPSPMFVANSDQEFIVMTADSFNCTSYDTIQITVFETCSEGFLMFPNIFTPNNDGLNDFFRPVRQFNLIPEIKYLRIFDRWGKVLYESNNIIEGWDGTHEGRTANNGVYVYALEIYCQDGSTSIKTGNVTLIR